MKLFNQLSERQQQELTKLLPLYLKSGDYKAALGSEEDVLPYVRYIRDEYDSIYRLAKERGAQAFVDKFDDVKGKQPLKQALFEKVQEEHLSQEVIPTENRVGLEGRFEIFRLLQGRGNPNWKSKVTAAQVVRKAQELIKEKGWKRYEVKRKGSRYSELLKQDVAEALGISTASVHRHLSNSNYEMPLQCRAIVR